MKSFFLLLAIGLGILIPQAHTGAVVVRPLLMAMLFFSFLKMNLTHFRLQFLHIKIVLVNLALALFLWLVFRYFFSHISTSIALSAFFVAAAPTATASPSVISYLGGKGEFGVVAVVLNNLVMAVFLVLILPFIAVDVSMNLDSLHWFDLAFPVLLTIGFPFVLAMGLRQILPNASQWKLSNVGFSIWAMAIFFVCARASHFIQNSGYELSGLVSPALISLVLCIVQFTLGHFMGGADQKIEASQALGQKNTIFTIWICLHWFSPEIALAPIFYVIWQNIFISLRMKFKSKQVAPNEQ